MRTDLQCKWVSRTVSIKMQQVYLELEKATKKTCFCILEYSAKTFGGWREGENVLTDDQECTASGEHVKCDLFLCEIARQEKHATVPKVTRKHDLLYKRGVRKKEGEEKSYFCHLENPAESIQQYRKSKGKLCTALVDDYMKGEPCVEGMNNFQITVDSLNQNEGTRSHPQVGTIVYKGTTSGVYYTEPSYPPFYGSNSTTNLTHGEAESLSDHPSQQQQQRLVANDDWLPGNAVYQERSGDSTEQLYDSVGYYHHHHHQHGSISLLKPVIKPKRCNSPPTLREKIAVKHLKKKGGKHCTVVEYNKTDTEQLAAVTTVSPKESTGQLRSAKMKSSFVESNQNKLQDLVVTQSYASTTKLETRPRSRQNSGKLRSKKSRVLLAEKREAIVSIPSKSSSLSRLPELHVSSQGLTATPDSEGTHENGSGDSNQSIGNVSKVKSNALPLLDRPPLPFAAKQQISDRLQRVSKQLIHRHTNLPRPFKPLTRAKCSPFHGEPNNKITSTGDLDLEKQGSDKRTTKSGLHFEEARCVLRSRERRRGRFNKRVGGRFYQERTSYRVKVCLKGSKVPLVPPPTKTITEDNSSNYYNVEELYAE